MTETSKKWTLNNADWSAILKGAVIAGIGAGGAFGLDQINLIDFGSEGNLLVAAVISIAVNAIRKFITVK